jgi:hypothetical protein
MTLAFLFWLFMILWFVFGLWQGWGATNTPAGQYVLGGHVLLFILFLLLGLHAFGWPIKT